VLNLNLMFCSFSLLVYCYIFFRVWNTKSLIPTQNAIPLNDEQEKTANQARSYALLASGFTGIVFTSYLANITTVIPFHLILEINGFIIPWFIVNLFLFRKSQVWDYELYNVPIFWQPACENCGSSQHSQIYCNAPTVRPVADWAPAIDSLVSEPLGDRGDLKRRFYYLKGLSQPTGKKINRNSNDFDALDLLDKLNEIHKNGFKLTQEQRKNPKKAIQAYKQSRKIRTDKVVSTPFGPVGSDFPLQCSGPSKSKEKIEHVATFHKKFENLQKHSDVELEKFLNSAIGQSCDKTGCIGSVELRNG